MPSPFFRFNRVYSSQPGGGFLIRFHFRLTLTSIRLAIDAFGTATEDLGVCCAEPLIENTIESDSFLTCV